MQLQIDKLNIPGEGRRPLIIAGPCSAESEEQLLDTALQLKAKGIRILRAGIWKPRTKPGGFEGKGKEALPWLQRVKEETGMLVATEAATPEHVELSLKAGVDIFWIGARTTANPFAVQALADALRGVDIPVFVKNPINPDLELWIGAIERLNEAGVTRLGAIHRGFSCYNQKIYRYSPMWQIPIELRRRIPEMMMLCDPSHISGRRDLVAGVSQQAMDLHMDGLIIESHCDPDNALSDARQQITPDTLEQLLGNLIIRKEILSSENIDTMRRQIDDIDDQILEMIGRRMQVCRDIGEYKKEHDMTVVHEMRYSEIIDRWESRCEQLGIDREFVNRMFGLIHQESIRQQIEILNNKK